MSGFVSPCSTVVEAADGTLLGARIADDGQWRFPESGRVPEKFEKALLTYEDRWFRYHPGVNPVALVRAVLLNIRARSVVSGGSTITMQVARISQHHINRSYAAKFSEILSAFKLELFHSKREILRMYASNAPFGGNTVGLDAAAWRYSGKAPAELSWAETAALAVLPNSPSLVYPGKNSNLLHEKRDRLLRKLFERGIIDSLTLSLSLDEPLLMAPSPLPEKAPHLTDYFYLKRKGERIRTTIDAAIQEKAVSIINLHQRELEENFIWNSSCIITDVKNGAVLAYVGNSTLVETKKHEGAVDIIRSPRSTGSILKPLLYAAMQQSGDLLPNSLVADVPARFQGFSPKNADKSYRGAVPAAQALSQSLNIPAVKMLQKYNPEKFLQLLRETGFTGFNKDAGYYGLSLILGGGETTLWDLAGVYASLSRVLNRYLAEQKYCSGDFHPLILTEDEKKGTECAGSDLPVLQASAIWLTYKALRQVNRPGSEAGWQYFPSSPNVAWKTGTSYGFRDSWAVGTTTEYVIAIWAGNATGAGRPGLTGISSAAPVLFDMLRIMPGTKWFEAPLSDLTTVKVCSKSGFRAGPDCPETEEVMACASGLKSDPCPYHPVVHLNKDETFRINTSCASPSEIVNKSWFVLPPAMEYYYRQKNAGYRPLPPLLPGCTDVKTLRPFEFIYPVQGVKIFIPRDHTGREMKFVAEVVHRNSSVKIYWHLDDNYLGTTQYIHQYEISAGRGEHRLTVVDEEGNREECRFEII